MTKTKTRPSALTAVCPGIFAFCIWSAAACQGVRANKGNYFPLSVGNSWTYLLRGHTEVPGKTIKWKITQREVIRGIPVFHLWQTPSQDDEPLSLAEVETGIREAGTERFLLKKPLRIGERWSAKSRSLRAPGKSDAFEVTSDGKPCSVEEHSFDDCTVIREIDEANDVASLTTYARGVGPVKYVYFKGPHSEEVDTTLTIKSWEVH